MSDKLIPIEGSVPVNKHKMLGAANPKERLEVTIKLRRKTEEGLPTLNEFVAGKRAFMTRQQLAERHGARREDATAVQSWAVNQGLSVSRVDLGRRQIHLLGSLAAMSHAFGVKLLMYEHLRTGSKFRCPSDNIHVPEDLAPIITGVFGLNDMPVIVRTAVRAATRTANADPKMTWPGSFFPNEVAQLYNFPPTQGAGQRVAILEFGGGFDQSVLTDYFSNSIGLRTSPTVNALMVMGSTMQIDDDATGEVYLDIEVVGAMAPGATMDVYFAPWSGAGFLNAIDQAIHNDDYAAVSISYGLDEDVRGTASNPGWPMLHQNLDEAFRDATAVGIPIFISSGDQGSGSSRGPDDVTLLSTTAHASFPATSPYVTSVGGTMLYATNGAITNEVVWNELGDLQNDPQIGKFYAGGATGGGVSDRYPQVPSYQSGAGITPQSVNNSSTSGRGVPDVAGNAGASTGYLVSQPPNSSDPIAPVGGTSAAAPMWAALMACVREALQTNFNGKVPVFFFNDFVYAQGNTTAFRDIVGGRAFTNDPNTGEPIPGQFIPIGNNRSTQVDGYYAQQGFDFCTGWGSPNGQELLKQLQSWLVSQQGN
jgi:kumamolisin